MGIYNRTKMWRLMTQNGIRTLRTLYTGIFLMLTCGFTLTSPVILQAADPSKALSDVAGRAERTTERNLQIQTYYGRQRILNKQKKEGAAFSEKDSKTRQDKEISFEVKEIKVTSSAYLSQEDIERAIHFPGPGLFRVADLNAMVDRVNALYMSKGIMTAKAVLPPQKVEDGVVYIRLIEGKYGKTIITGNRRIHDSYIRHRVNSKSGKLVDLGELQKSVDRYNAGNTYQISATVVPGTEVGTSDVELVLTEQENPWNTIIFADNSGQVESGRYRVGTYSEYRGIGGKDAGFYIAPTWTEGIWGGSIGFDTPLGTKGTRMAVSYSRNIVHIIDGAFSDFNLKSQSNDLGLTINHPLAIKDNQQWNLFVEGHRKWSDTTYAGMELSDNRTNTVKLGSTFRSYDRRGMWFGLLSVTGYDSRARTAGITQGGHYYNVYLMRRQVLPAGQDLIFRAYGQYSDYREMPSTEQFSLGGMNTVRGYREGLLSGDKGWFAGLEYHFPLTEDYSTWRGLLFADHGVSYSNYSDLTKRYFISSAGIGLEYRKNGWYGKAVYGIPVNHSHDIHGEHPRIHFYIERHL